MEIPRHVIFASYWLSLKSSQSSIEATEYVEGNVGDAYFSFGNVFSFFLLFFSVSKGVIPLKNSHEEVEIEAGFQRFNKKFAEKNLWDYKF